MWNSLKICTYMYSHWTKVIFNVTIPGTFTSFAMQNPHRIFTFDCVIKPEALEGAFQNR